MRPADLSTIEIVDLLDAAYREDRGWTRDGPDDEERKMLADFLGCHEGARAEAWEAWCSVLELEGQQDPSDAEYWLDVEFIGPCPE